MAFVAMVAITSCTKQDDIDQPISVAGKLTDDATSFASNNYQPTTATNKPTGYTNNPADQQASNAPILPPKETMVLPVSGQSGKAGGAQGIAHFVAATAVGFWNTILTVNVALPVAAFAESFKYTPFFLDGKWHWVYFVNVNNVFYLANLQAVDNGTTIDWKMLVSKQGEFSNYVWFTGTSDKDGNNGNWTIMQGPGVNAPYLGIEWTKESDKVGNIKFTNLVEGDGAKGSYIHAGLINDPQYNAFYTIFSKADNNLGNIEWDTNGSGGRIKSPGAFGNASWHCWDWATVDIICPE